MVKVSLGATIPTGQYANLQPLIEVESESIDGGLEAALGHIKKLWDRTSSQPLDINRNAPAITSTPQGQVLRCRVSGTEVIFDPIAHSYHDRDGRRYMGGSTFASKYKAPFAAEAIAQKMAAKNGVEASEILAMWKLNAEASSTFGTSVHAALQLYGEYLELSKSVKNGSDESALTSNPVLRPIVQAFFTEERRQETAFYEEFTANSRELACGLIDRLVVEDNGELIIEDYKSSATMDRPETILPPFKDTVPNTVLGGYFIQLSYYARILMAHGRRVKCIRVHHWDGNSWVTYENDVIDLSPAFGSN